MKSTSTVPMDFRIVDARMTAACSWETLDAIERETAFFRRMGSMDESARPTPAEIASHFIENANKPDINYIISCAMQQVIADHTSVMSDLMLKWKACKQLIAGVRKKCKLLHSRIREFAASDRSGSFIPLTLKFKRIRARNPATYEREIPRLDTERPEAPLLPKQSAELVSSRPLARPVGGYG
jgi:hypothetical protein